MSPSSLGPSWDFCLRKTNFHLVRAVIILSFGYSRQTAVLTDTMSCLPLPHSENFWSLDETLWSGCVYLLCFGSRPRRMGKRFPAAMSSPSRDICSVRLCPQVISLRGCEFLTFPDFDSAPLSLCLQGLRWSLYAQKQSPEYRTGAHFWNFNL